MKVVFRPMYSSLYLDIPCPWLWQKCCKIPLSEFSTMDRDRAAPQVGIRGTKVVIRSQRGDFHHFMETFKIIVQVPSLGVRIQLQFVRINEVLRVPAALDLIEFATLILPEGLNVLQQRLFTLVFFLLG